MKILYLSYTYWPPDFGGGLLHTIERLEEMAMKGHSVLVFTSGCVRHKNKSSINGIFVQRSFFAYRNNFITKILHRLFFIFSAAWILIYRKYDVLHIGSLPGFDPISSSIIGVIFVLLAHLQKARVVYLYSLAENNDQSIELNGVQGLIRKCFFNNIDNLVVNSPKLYSDLNPIFPRNVNMILNGAKDQIFCPNISVRNGLRASLNIPSDSTVFTFLGSFSKRKGADLLLDAFSEILIVTPNSYLWIIGPKDKNDNRNLEEGELQELLTQSKEIPNIHFWGRIDDRDQLASLLAASDVFVFPTRREGMPMAPLQAMSSGLPVIISRIPGVTDLANIEGETGFYITPGSVEELKVMMIKLATDVSLRKSMGKKARQRILGYFSWDQHIAIWEQLYLRGLNE